MRGFPRTGTTVADPHAAGLRGERALLWRGPRRPGEAERGALPCAAPLLDMAERGVLPLLDMAERGVLPLLDMAERGALPLLDVAERGALPLLDVAERGVLPCELPLPLLPMTPLLLLCVKPVALPTPVTGRAARGLSPRGAMSVMGLPATGLPSMETMARYSPLTWTANLMR